MCCQCSTLYPSSLGLRNVESACFTACQLESTQDVIVDHTFKFFETLKISWMIRAPVLYIAIASWCRCQLWNLGLGTSDSRQPNPFGGRDFLLIDICSHTPIQRINHRQYGCFSKSGNHPIFILRSNKPSETTLVASHPKPPYPALRSPPAWSEVTSVGVDVLP